MVKKEVLDWIQKLSLAIVLASICWLFSSVLDCRERLTVLETKDSIHHDSR